MSKWGKWSLVACAALVAAAVLTACNQAQQQEGGGDQGGNQENAQEQKVDIAAVTEQWVSSAHSSVVTFAAEESFCAGCHDGSAFASGTAEPPFQERGFHVATDCRACHTGRGNQLMTSGEVTITTTSETVNAGTGAVCLGCHRELAAPAANNPERNGPHPSSQGSVWTGTGGLTDGLSLKSTRRHRGLPKACVSCHMTEQDGMASHEMEVDTEQACAECHENAENLPNPTAKADYDGDGQEEGFQDEVRGLQATLTSATLEAAQATTLTEEQGQIKFRNGQREVADFDEKTYQAAYNLLLTEVDGSYGVHNPAYVVGLLQQTYRQLTGREITNAVQPD